MSRFTGKEVYEMLEKMTEEERARCVFPGFFDDEEYEILKSEVANNASGVDDVDDENGKYQRILNVPNGKVAELMSNALDEWCEEWGEYIDRLKTSVAHALEHIAEK